VYDRRFYVKDSRIYLPTYDLPSQTGSVWMLDLDSLETPHIGIAEQFSDGSKRIVINGINRNNRDVTVNFVPGAGTMTAVDSIKLALWYDPNVLDSLSFSLPAGWWIADSVSHGGVLDLVLRDSVASPLPSPLLQVTFKASLATRTTFIYLDSATSYLKHTSCDFSTLSLASPDSVEIDFEGCGDSTLLRFMATGSPLEFTGITPNPLSDGATISFTLAARSQVAISVIDAAGREWAVISQEMGAGQHKVTWDATGFPSGVYTCRLSAGGASIVRKMVVLH
jgi:hypothetical protein